MMSDEVWESTPLSLIDGRALKAPSPKAFHRA